jgi:membrane associated rhomboid family serine protease
LLLSSRISDIGLCGLSGTAHGLMVLSALQSARKPDGFAIGVLCLLLVAGKSVYETISGNVVFEFMHMGMCGTAIASCHLGGVAGGAVAFLVFDSGKKSLGVAPPTLESFR